MTEWCFLDYDTVVSTNDLAKNYSQIFAGRPVVFTAAEQTGGRGRRGRSWISERGNLFFSQLFVPDINLSELAFVTSLSLAEAVVELSKNLNVAVKWPNDVLLDGRKISGILIEQAENNTVVVGIGVNLLSSPSDSEVIYRTASLSDFGVKIAGRAFLEIYLRHFDRNLQVCREQGFALIRRNWLAFAYRLNEPIGVRCGEKELSGIFKGIDEQGFLLLQQKEKIIKIAAGDVFL